jgi:hypothetical protein
VVIPKVLKRVQHEFIIRRSIPEYYFLGFLLPRKSKMRACGVMAPAGGLAWGSASVKRLDEMTIQARKFPKKERRKRNGNGWYRMD